jgi:hypothetical protein
MMTLTKQRGLRIMSATMSPKLKIPALLLSFLMGGCASFEQMNACNSLAYQQAPPIYDSRQTFMMMQCPYGIGPFSPMFPKPGLPPQPFFCNQLMVEDLNYWARRSVFDACMKGVQPTSVVLEPAVEQPSVLLPLPATP